VQFAHLILSTFRRVRLERDWHEASPQAALGTRRCAVRLGRFPEEEGHRVHGLQVYFVICLHGLMCGVILDGVDEAENSLGKLRVLSCHSQQVFVAQQVHVHGITACPSRAHGQLAIVDTVPQLV